MNPSPQTIALSLVSHTNAGKTTLARTLLQRDVGQVRDTPHVTEFAEDHLLLRTEAGDELRLWDTPGFGDSVRLVRRLRAQGNPVGWFLSEVWDRWRDRPFWASQVALRHVRERADVVLYLVNAAESPEAAAYVEPEMALLAWVGKPVIVLLNQLGAPRAAEEELQDIERWRRHLSPHGRVLQVLPMDAFARCWVQEGALLRAVQAALADAEKADAEKAGAEKSSGAKAGETGAPHAPHTAMERILAQWSYQRLASFERAMAALACSLGRIAAARVEVAGGAGGLGMGQAVRRLGAALGPLFGGTASADDPASLAQRRLAELLDEELRAGTAELIALHGLEGRAQGEILARVAAQFEQRTRVDEGKAALVGGMLSGALAGLKADIATGGLTLGGGLLAGGLLGALGAAGLARGINLMRGGGPPSVGWSAEALGPLVESALLRYLAVAHFGRGRGEWAEGEAPAHWREVAAAALQPQQAALAALWKGRGQTLENPGEAERLASALQPVLTAAAQAALERLYPGAWPAAPGASPGSHALGAKSSP